MFCFALNNCVINVCFGDSRASKTSATARLSIQLSLLGGTVIRNQFSSAKNKRVDAVKDYYKAEYYN